MPTSIEVRLFARVAEAMGRPSVTLSVDGTPTVGAVRAAAARFGVPLAESSLIAVNAAYAPDDHVVTSDDEIALIHPVTGG